MSYTLNTMSYLPSYLQRLDEDGESLQEKIYGGRPDWAKPAADGIPRAEYAVSTKNNGVISTPNMGGDLTNERRQPVPRSARSARTERDLPGKLFDLDIESICFTDICMQYVLGILEVAGFMCHGSLVQLVKLSSDEFWCIDQILFCSVFQWCV